MTFESIYVCCILLLMLAALIADRLRPGLILFSAVVLMLCGHIINPKEALEGFSNKGMITVALLYLVSEGVRKSGMLERIIYRLLPSRNVSVARGNLRFLPVISFLSAFLNNTPVVVIFAPMIKNWAKKFHLPPTKFLIPLSYATILGGMCTLIGTSTNLVVDGLIQDAGLQGMQMFELGKVGIFIALTGMFYMIMIAPHLLPNERKSEQEIEDPTNNSVRYEVMLSTRFPGLGKTLHEFDFYHHYGVNVRGLIRHGSIVTGDYMNMRLSKEDTLIIDSDDKFYTAWKESRVFLMINRVGDIELPLGTRKRWISLVLVLLMIIGATLGEQLPLLFPDLHLNVKLDMFFFACVTTVFMAWTGIFTPKRYTKFISWDVLITIACAFGISKGMINSGFADFIAGFIIDLAEQAKHSDRGIYIMLAALYIITNLFTELITNNAAAALSFPLALSISQRLGCDPTPFFVCICFAASAAFSTPIGYQTNLIVQGVGGYRFTDFVKVGLPMNIIVFLLSVFLIPLFY